MARTKNGSTSSTCPRCASLILPGSLVCGLCRFDLISTPVSAAAKAPEPIEVPVTEPVMEWTSFEPVATDLVVVEPEVAERVAVESEIAEPVPVEPVPVEPRIAYESTSVFLPIDALPMAEVAPDEPTPLAPVELLSERPSADFSHFNPRDPFSWYPVISA